MRNFAVIVLFLFLLGCTQSQPQVNQTTPPQPATNATVVQQNTSLPIVSSGNISMVSPEPVQNTSSANSTTNSTPIMNQTANQSVTNATQVTPVPAGLIFPDSNYTLVLDDVSLVPTSEQPCGIFSIRDPSNNILDKQLICPQQEATWVSPEGHLYRIELIKVAAGYSTHTEWASVEIFG